ncbi:two-component sensor histidine kinase [Sorangium cellulosum So ce56]|uniref:histidine kinase n=1 Tax=Sorangium cellulosum (strain So ce56) TaxID=448385 RepID=A9FC70_SORC5|nr:GAF domain-containing sensor histidine kinase [Sorangium cellulosum]CAN91632.1 two-component sensor histidine kinase [Sorangium cellulosum So ce56]
MSGKEASSKEGRLVSTLQRLLELPAADLRQSLNQASDLLAGALCADKIDIFLFDPSRNTLHALGTSKTPMGRLQRSLGLDIHPVANGGSIARVFTTGDPHITGHSEQEPGELPGLVNELGVRSHIAVRLAVDGERRGVVSAHSAAPEFFSDEDLRFLGAVAHWIGALTHRAELVEQVTSAALAQGRRQAAEELITVLAHDLRNHLTPLMGRLGLLRRRAELDGRVDDVRDADRATESVARLGQLISDLLDVGRIEQGLFEIAPAPMDLVSLARDIAVALGTPSVEIRVEGPRELVVVADRDRLRQAVENLVSNAIKHSPPGKGVLITLTSELIKGTEHAHVDVVDRGSGVPPEILPRIFDRFVTDGYASGMGLGLYLASRIAAAHGATLAVSSPPGNGATFRLSLPASGPPARGDDP